MKIFVAYIIVLIGGIIFSSSGFVSNSFKITSSPKQLINIKVSDGISNSSITLLNTSNQDLNIEWLRDSINLTKGWDYSICMYGKCLPGVPEAGSFKTLKPQEEGFIKFHIIPQGITGKGIVRFKVYNKADAEDFEILTFEIHVTE